MVENYESLNTRTCVKLVSLNMLYLTVFGLVYGLFIKSYIVQGGQRIWGQTKLKTQIFTDRFRTASVLKVYILDKTKLFIKSALVFSWYFFVLV